MKKNNKPLKYSINIDYTVKVLKEEVYRLNKQKDNLSNSLLENNIIMNAIDVIDKRIIELNNNINFLNEYR